MSTKKRDPSACSGPCLLSHNPSRYIIFNRLSSLLSSQLFSVGCDAPAYMLADSGGMSHVAETMLAALACAGETLEQVKPDGVLNGAVLVTFATLILDLEEVLTSFAVPYFAAFVDLIRSNIGNICCNSLVCGSCHFRKSLSNMLYFLCQYINTNVV